MSDLKPARIPAWAVLVLLAILVFDVWFRCHTIGPTIRDQLGVDLWPVTGAEAEPLDCDEAVYAYTGRRIVHGSVMYRDLTEPKPPGGYWLYALAVAVGGANELTVRVTPIPIVLATIGIVWWIALRLGGPFAACLAALIYSVTSTDPYLFGNGANLEHPINLFSTASLALMIAGWDRSKRGWLFGAGVCLGIACLFKQVAFTHGLIYTAALLLRRRSLRITTDDVLELALGFAVVWGAAFLALILQGAGAAAFEDIVRYSAAMAADTPPEANAPSRWVRWITGNADPQGELPWPFGKTNYLVWWGTGSWPLWLVAIPATASLGLTRSSTPGRRLVAAWT
ncbi:ArnT family glycosyltransferase, partial [Singulisphaera rosea]